MYTFLYILFIYYNVYMILQMYSSGISRGAPGGYTAPGQGSLTTSITQKIKKS